MFDTHMLNDAGKEEMKKFKETVAMSTAKAASLMPEGRERSLFLTKLEEAVFFGAKAIAAKPENHSEVIKY